MVPNGWSRIKVDDLIRRGVLALNDGYRVRNVELGAVGIPFVRGGDIGDGNIKTDVQDHIRPEFADRVRSKLTRPFDVAFITKGTVGRVGMVRPGQPTSVFAPQVCYWRSLDTEELEPRFLFYLLRSAEFQSNLDAVKTHGSMVADYVSMSDQRAFQLPIPPIREQRTIAAILGTLDDKIELNRRTNATLDAIARTFFQSWFFNFDPVRAKRNGGQPIGLDSATAALFPGEFQESELGPIPKGWHAGSIGSCKYCSMIGSGIQRFNGQKTFLATAEVDEGRIIGAGVSVDYASRPSRANMQPEMDSVWFAKMKDSPKYILINRATSWIVEHVILSTGFAGIRCAPRSATYVYAYISSTSFDSEKNLRSIGTTMQAVNNDLIRSIPIVIPPEEITTAFDRIVGPVYELIAQIENESRSLAATRDALMPKLLSGNLRIPELNTL